MIQFIPNIHILNFLNVKIVNAAENSRYVQGSKCNVKTQNLYH